MIHIVRKAAARAVFAVTLAALPIQAFAAADITQLTADANAGKAEAQFQLGNAYMKGDGVPANPAEALKWCRMAAEQDYVPAEMQLSLKYLNGTGVTADPVEADKWMVIAANRESKNQSMLRFVEGRMKPDDIHHGHVSAEQWMADHPVTSKPPA